MRTSAYQKIGAGFLMVVFAAVAVYGSYPNSAQAQVEGAGFVLSAIGLAKPQLVTDPVTESATAATQVSTIGGWLAQAARFAIDNGLKIALAALKKRLIDTMTDEIIAWINGGGSPKFIQNFAQQVFQPALNQAVGDTAEQILPSLCSPYIFRVNLELSAPQPLNQPSACTLNSIVSNFNAFQQNFAAGGFIGYSELLQPQNNPYGVDILTQDALYNNVQQTTAQNVLQTQVNVGFNSQQCFSWEAFSRSGPLFNGKPVASNDYQDPSNPPPVMDASGGFSAVTQTMIQDLGGDPSNYRPANFSWQCADMQISTPGRALSEGLNQALYANLRLTINDPQITDALAMIADAAFNRLIKAGVQGVQGIVQSATTGGNGSQTLSQVSPGQIVTGAEGQSGSGSLGQAIGNASGLVGQAASSTQTTYSNQLNQAANSIADASTTLATVSATNQELVASGLQPLITCLGPTSSSTDLTWATSTLAVAQATASTTIPAYEAQTASLATTVNDFLNTVQNADASALNQVNPNDIATAASNASQIDSDVQALLSGIQSTLGTAQTKLTQCQASH